MSETISPGLVDESHWTFVAASMADALRKGAGDPATVHRRIPKGVYRAARDFFRPIVEALGESIPTSPVVSVANYAMAFNALTASVSPARLTEEESNLRLKEFSAILDGFSSQGSSPPPDTRDLEGLAAFFERIAEEGEKKASEKHAYW
jgi:hypothetical protein